LRKVREFLHGFLGCFAHLAFVFEHVFQADAAVRANFTVRDFPSLEQSNQVWSGDAQQVGGLLGTQFGLNGCECDGVAICHFAKDALQEFHGGQWQYEAFVLVGLLEPQMNFWCSDVLKYAHGISGEFTVTVCGQGWGADHGSRVHFKRIKCNSSEINESLMHRARAAILFGISLGNYLFSVLWNDFSTKPDNRIRVI
jgi:hypothetical protein